MDEVALNRLFASVNAKLDTFDELMTLVGPQLAPDFNMIGCAYPDENRLSAIIAMLLDPKGEHGQGTTFLQLFLEHLSADFSADAYAVRQRLEVVKDLCTKELRAIRTERKLEVPTKRIENCQRRIDILLDLNGFGLAIENKPWAIDQPRQIEDYINHLKHDFRDNYLIIYLSGNGKPPGIDSISIDYRNEKEKSGHFVVMSYLQLKEWCAHCVEKCRSPRVRYFLEDFQSYIRNTFEGGVPMDKENLIVAAATKTPENIAAAFVVAQSWPAITRKLMGELAELVCLDPRIDKSLSSEVDFNIHWANTGIWFYKPNWKIFRLKIAFENTNTNNLFYGIQRMIPIQEQPIKLNVDSLNKSNGNEDWPWWQYFKKPFLNWSSSEEPWLGIKPDGETVKEVAEKLLYLIEEISDEIDKAERTAILI